VPDWASKEPFSVNIDQFAVTHHARVRRDECGEPIIKGKLWKHQPKVGRVLNRYRHRVCLVGESTGF
jgi:hypothetical protein